MRSAVLAHDAGLGWASCECALACQAGVPPSQAVWSVGHPDDLLAATPRPVGFTVVARQLVWPVVLPHTKMLPSCRVSPPQPDAPRPAPSPDVVDEALDWRELRGVSTNLTRTTVG